MHFVYQLYLEPALSTSGIHIPEPLQSCTLMQNLLDRLIVLCWDLFHSFAVTLPSQHFNLL